MTQRIGIRKTYSLFEKQITAGLLSLKASPKQIVSRLNYLQLPSFSAPVEVFEVEAQFSGAECLVTFGESVVQSGLLFCQVELHRAGERTLFLDDYLAQQKNHRQKLLSFRDDEISVEAGIANMVEVLVSVLNEELLPVLQGQIWMTAPFDWGDYK